MHAGLRNNPGALARACLIGLMLVCASLPGSAAAALGGDMESVDADQAAMNATSEITASTEFYTVYELRTETGAVVREYLSLAGSVFAVAWQGPLLPNLRLLLGDYFAQYTEAAQNQHGDHGRLVVRQADLVVESSGHMRAFIGRAYLPRALPQDVAVTDIQ
jgi:hypothetical protein